MCPLQASLRPRPQPQTPWLAATCERLTGTGTQQDRGRGQADAGELWVFLQCGALSSETCVNLHERQLGSCVTACATDSASSQVSWPITFPAVVRETELMYVKQHTWYYGYSREELMGDRLEERREREGGYTFR